MPLIQNLRTKEAYAVEKLLSVNELEVTYTTAGKTVRAVNSISFDLGKKETLGLVGETGAGKTTTALSILRLLPERTGKIVKGRIEFLGRDIVNADEKEMQLIRGNKISMIFQDPMSTLNPSVPVGKQILEALILHNYENKNSKQLNARVDELLTQVGISPIRKNNYPHEFSGGMKQRIVIAMSLACNPMLLIADEPTSALDVTVQAQVLTMIEALKHRYDMSMIMITHDLGIIANTCDKVAVMYAGEFVEFGTIDDVFTGNEHHPYTKGLFNSIPNINDDSDRLTPIIGLMPDPTNLPQGCKFHPRCNDCMKICKNENPPAIKRGTHIISCHLYKEEINE